MTQGDLLTGSVPNAEDRGADLSDDGRYRFRLWRIWDWDMPVDCWIMLNPSTADATDDDLTIKKCRGFSQRGGLAGGIMVVNLYALRATDPADLLRSAHPVGTGTDVWLLAEARAAGRVIAAWGANVLHGRVGIGGRDEHVLGLLAARRVPVLCLGTTRDGHPRHPSRLAYDTPFVPFRRAA